MKKEGIVTKYNHNCLFCGRPLEATHHLIGGTSKRSMSDQDGLSQSPAVMTATTWVSCPAGSMEIPWQRLCQRS